jgi:hypothetical protein
MAGSLDRAKKQEARSKKQEARSKKQEARRTATAATCHLLASDNRQWALLTSVFFLLPPLRSQDTISRLSAS